MPAASLDSTARYYYYYVADDEDDDDDIGVDLPPSTTTMTDGRRLLWAPRPSSWAREAMASRWDSTDYDRIQQPDLHDDDDDDYNNDVDDPVLLLLLHRLSCLSWTSMPRDRLACERASRDHQMMTRQSYSRLWLSSSSVSLIDGYLNQPNDEDYDDEPMVESA